MRFLNYWNENFKRNLMDLAAVCGVIYNQGWTDVHETIDVLYILLLLHHIRIELRRDFRNLYSGFQAFNFESALIQQPNYVTDIRSDRDDETFHMWQIFASINQRKNNSKFRLVWM